MKKIFVVATDHPSDDNRVFGKCVAPLAQKYHVHYAWDARFDDATQLRASIRDKNYTISWHPIERKKGGGLGRLEMFRHILGCAAKIQPCVCHLHCGPPSLWLARKIHALVPECKVIYDSHEHDPDAYVRVPLLRGLAGFVRSVTIAYEKTYLQNVDHVVVTSWSFQRYFQELTKDNIPVTVILNTLPPGTNLDRNKAVRHFDGKNINIGFVGNFYANRCLEQAVLIVKALQVRGFKAKLVLIGKFATKEYEKIFMDFLEKHSCKDSVVFAGFLKDPTAILEQLSRVLWGWNVLIDASDYNLTLANKIFTYLEAAIPVIAAKHSQETVSFLSKHSSGLVLTTPEDADLCAEELIRVTEDNYQALSCSALKVGEEYSYSSTEQKLFELYQALF